MFIIEIGGFLPQCDYIQCFADAVYLARGSYTILISAKPNLKMDGVKGTFGTCMSGSYIDSQWGDKGK